MALSETAAQDIVANETAALVRNTIATCDQYFVSAMIRGFSAGLLAALVATMGEENARGFLRCLADGIPSSTSGTKH